MTTLGSVTSDTPSVVDRTRLLMADTPIVGAHMLDGTTVFVLGEQELLFVSFEGEERRIPVHDGAILSATLAKDRIITGGDDGTVVATNMRGESETLVTDP